MGRESKFDRDAIALLLLMFAHILLDQALLPKYMAFGVICAVLPVTNISQGQA